MGWGRALINLPKHPRKAGDAQSAFVNVLMTGDALALENGSLLAVNPLFTILNIRLFVISRLRCTVTYAKSRNSNSKEQEPYAADNLNPEMSSSSCQININQRYDKGLLVARGNHKNRMQCMHINKANQTTSITTIHRLSSQKLDLRHLFRR